MEKPLTILVINPHRQAWAVRFSSEEAAWSRLLALKNMKARREGRIVTQDGLQSEGWRVVDRSEVA